MRGLQAVRPVSRLRRAPVGAHRYPATGRFQQAAGRELGDPGDHRVRGGDVTERGVEPGGVTVDAPSLVGEDEERLYLGGEPELVVHDGPEERLDRKST